ncbi:MAG: hypothetical protein KDD36_07655 [Flavobacteriales bacterium]|nr:hypothetical protein [Flavobacteriales bacterium]
MKRPDEVSALQIHQVIRYGTLLGIGVTLARSGMPVGDIGRFELILFAVAATSYFWVGGLHQGLMAGTGKMPSTRSKVPGIAHAFIWSQIMAVISGLAAVVYLRIHNEEPQLITLAFLYTCLMLPSYLGEYIYFIKKNTRGLLRLSVFSHALLWLMVAYPAMNAHRIDWCIQGLLLAAGFRFVWVGILVLREIEWTGISKGMITIARAAWPLALAALVSGSAEYIDGLVISGYFGDGEFALFRYGAREFPLAVLLATGLSHAMVARIAADDNPDRLSELRERSSRLINRIMPVAIILMITSQWLYPLVFGDRFVKSALIFNIYLLLVIPRLVFPQTVIIGKGLQRVIPKLAVIEVITNVVVSLVLVYFMDMPGVAVGTVVAFSLEKWLLIRYNRKNLGIPAEDYIPVRRLITWSLALAAALFFSLCI